MGMSSFFIHLCVYSLPYCLITLILLITVLFLSFLTTRRGGQKRVLFSLTRPGPKR